MAISGNTKKYKKLFDVPQFPKNTMKPSHTIFPQRTSAKFIKNPPIRMEPTEQLFKHTRDKTDKKKKNL